MGGQTHRFDGCKACDWQGRSENQHGSVCPLCESYMAGQQRRKLSDLEDAEYKAEVKAASL